MVMKKHGLFIFLLWLLLVSHIFAGSISRVNNRLVFTETFSGNESMDPLYPDQNNVPYLGSGLLQIGGTAFGGWDGPSWDIQYFPKSQKNYVVIDAVKADVRDDGTYYGYGVMLGKFDLNGDKSWPSLVWVQRRTNASDINYYLGYDPSSYPSLALDTNENIYVAWNSKIANGNQYIWIQKFTNAAAPAPAWNNGIEVRAFSNINYYYCNPRIDTYQGYIYVVAGNNSSARIQKINSTNGQRMWGDDGISIASISVYYPPDLKVGPDGILYIAYYHTGDDNIYLQKRSVDTGTQIDSAFQINETSGRYSDTSGYWYWSEENCAIDIDANTNIFVAWSLRYNGHKVWAQHLTKSGGSFTRHWSTGGNDCHVGVVNDQSASYVDLKTTDSEFVYVSWDSHNSDRNNHGILQQIRKSTAQQFANDIDLNQNYSFAHNGRIAVQGNNCLTWGQGFSYQRFNQAGNRSFNYWNRPYYQSGGSSGRLYRNVGRYLSINIIPGVVKKVHLSNVQTYTPDWGKIKWAFSGIGWNSANYNSNTNWIVETNHGSSTSFETNYDIPSALLGNNLEMQILMYAKTKTRENDGKETPIVYEYKVEALESYLGDLEVGTYENGQNTYGNLVINENGDNQNMIVFVYPDGTNSAEGFFFIKNEGNIGTNFVLKGLGNSAEWHVKYYDCVWNGTNWNTNQDITSKITTTGWTQSVKGYTNENQIKAIKLFATANAGLPDGNFYQVYLTNFAQAGSTWYKHDVAFLRAQATKYLPDIEVGTVLSNSVVLDYAGRGIYNSDATFQDKFLKADTNVIASYYVRIKNVGNADTLKINGYASSANFIVKYYDSITGTNLLPSSITQSSWSLCLNNNQSTQIRVDVIPHDTTAFDSEYDVFMDVISSNNIVQEDRIKLTTRVINSKADILVRTGSGSFIGDNIYNTNSNQQTVSNTADNGMTNIFVYRLQNQGTESMDMILYSIETTGLTTGWQVHYFDGSTEITTKISDPLFGYKINDVASGGSYDIIVKITPPASLNSGANEEMSVRLETRPEGAPTKSHKWDVGTFKTRCVSSRVDAIAVTTNEFGRGTINATSAGQSIFAYVSHLVTNSYSAIISNAADSPYATKIYSIQSNTAYWDVSYVFGISDITSSLSSGWISPILLAHSSITLHVSVHPNTNVNADMTNKILLKSVSLINTNEDIDVIRFNTSRVFPPDLCLKTTNDSTFFGDGLYGTNIPEQTSGGSYSTNVVIQGNTNDYLYVVKLQNDRLLSDTLKLTAQSFDYTDSGSDNGTNYWRVRYFQYIGNNIAAPEYKDPSKWTNITASIISTGHIVNNASGITNLIFKVGVCVTNTNIKEGYYSSVNLLASSLVTGYIDKIYMITTYGIARPDLIVSSSWNNIYESSNNYVQIITNVMDKASGHSFDFFIENNSPINIGNFYIKGKKSTNDWNLKYYDRSGGTNDVTASVGSSSGYFKIMSPQTTLTMRCVMTVATESAYSNGETFVEWVQVEPKDGNLIDRGSFVSIISDFGKPDLSLTNLQWTNFYEKNLASINQQQKTNLIEIGHSVEFPFLVYNNKNSSSELLRIHGDGDTGDFTAQYLWWNNGSWSNVTDRATAIGNQFKVVVGNNSCITMKLDVHLNVNSGYNFGDLEDFVIYAQSQGQQNSDYAKFWLKVADLGNPDIIMTNLTLSTQYWDDVKETTPSIQKQTVFLEKGYTNLVFLKLENDKSEGESLHLKSSAGGWMDDFFVDYFAITNSITNSVYPDVVSNYYTNHVGSQSNCLVFLKMTLKSNSTYSFSSNKSINLRLYSQELNVFDSCAFVLSVTDRGHPDIVHSSGSWDGVYSTNYSIQTTNLYSEVNFNRSYNFYIQNDRTDQPEKLNLHVQKNDAQYFKHDYFLKTASGWTNITDDVISGNFTVTLPAVSTATLMVSTFLTNNPKWAVGDSPLTNWVRVYSQGHLISDTSRFVFTIGDFSQPNILSESGGWSQRENVIISQITNYVFEKGETRNFLFQLNNDRNTNDNFIFSGTAISGDDFTLNYSLISNSVTNNITALATNLSGYTLFIGANTNKKLLTQVTLDSNSIYTLNQGFAFDMKLYSFEKTTLDSVRVITSVTDKGKPDIVQATNLAWNNLITTNYMVQSTTIDIEKNDTKIYPFFIQNDRPDKAENLNLHITGGFSGYTYQVYSYSGGAFTNITSLVASPTGLNLTLGAVSSKTLGFVNTLASNSSLSLGDNSCSYIFNLKSQGQLIHDKSRLIYHVVDNGMPDISLVDNTWTNIIEASPSFQITNLSIEKGHSNQIFVKLWNHKPAENEIEVLKKLYGFSDIYSGFSFRYEIDGADVSSSVITNQNLHVTITSNSNKILKILAYLDANSGYNLGFVQNNTTILESLGGSVNDSVKFNYLVSDFGKPNIIQTNYSNWTNITTVYGEQEKHLNINKGDTEYFYFYVRNDRMDFAENLKLTAETAGDDYHNFNVVYEVLHSGSWSNISSIIESANGFTNTFSQTSSITMRMAISLDALSSYELGEQPVEYHLIMDSGARLVSDKAKVVMNIVNTGNPDIDNLSNSWEGPIGESSQISNFSLEEWETNKVLLKLENDNTNKAFTYKLKDIDSGNHSSLYNVSYFVVTNDSTNDISSSVKSVGENIDIPAGTNVKLLTIISLKTNAFALGQSSEVRIQLATKDDYYHDNIKLVVSATDKGIPDITLNGQWTNEYASTYYEEVKTILIEKAETIHFPYYLENDRTDQSETMEFERFLENCNDFNITNYRLVGGVPIIVSSNCTLTNLSSVSRATMQLSITLKSNSGLAVGNSDANIKFNFISQRGKKSDKTKFIFSVVDKSRPDIYLTNQSWYKVYEDSPSSQRHTLDIEKGITNITYLSLGNSTNKNEIYNFKFTQDAIGDFSFKLYTMTNGIVEQDVTTASSNQYMHLSILSNTNKLLKIVSLLNKNSTHVLGVQKTLTFELLSLGQTKKDKVRLIYNVVDLGKPNIVQTNLVDWTNITENNSLQNRTLTIEKGEQIVFPFLIRNDRADAVAENLNFYRAISGGDASSFTTSVEIWKSGAWDSVTGFTQTLSPNSSRTMRLVSKLDSEYLNFGTPDYSVVFDLQSEARLVKDEAKIHFFITNTGHPDIAMSSSKWQGYGDDFTQLTNIPIESGISNILLTRLENDNTNKAFTYLLYEKDYQFNSGFHKYYYLTNNGWSSNVTFFVTNTGCFVNLSKKTNTYLKTILYLDNTIYPLDTIFATRLRFSTLDKNVEHEDACRITAVLADDGQPNISYSSKWTNANVTNVLAGNQWTNVFVEKGEKIAFDFYVKNSRNNFMENLLLTSWNANSYPDFSIQYAIFTNSGYVDITDSLTNGSGRSLRLSPNTQKTLQMKISLKTNSAYAIDGTIILSNYVKLFSQGRKKYDLGLFKFIAVDNNLPNIVKSDGTCSIREKVPVSQKISFPIERGYSNSFDFMLRNDRTDKSTDLRYKSTHLTNEYSIQYLFKTNSGSLSDVSVFVTNFSGNGFLFGNNPQITNFMRIKVSLPTNSTITNAVILYNTLYSLGHDQYDRMEFTVKVTDRGRPDLMTTNHFDNEYFPDITQLYSFSLEKGDIITNYILMQNDFTNVIGRSNERYTLKAMASSNFWTFSYGLKTNGSWINCNEVTNLRYLTIATHTIWTMRVITHLEDSNIVQLNDKFTNQVWLISRSGVKKDLLNLISIATDKGMPNITRLDGSWSEVEQDAVTIQVTNIFVETNHYYTNYIILENRKDTSESMLLKGFLDEDSNWEITIQSNNSSIDVATSIITNGLSLVMPSHSAVTMQIRLGVLSSTTNPIGFTNHFYLKLYSQGKLKKDMTDFGYILRAPQPDIVISSTTMPSSPDGSDIYGSILDLSNNTIDQKVSRGRALVGPASIYFLKLENDDYYNDIIYLRRTNISQQPGSWRFEIYNPDGIDVTMSLTNEMPLSISGRSNKIFTIKIFAYETTSMTNYNKLKFYAYSSKNTNKKDVSGMITTRVPVSVSGTVLAEYNSSRLAEVIVEVSDMSNHILNKLTTDAVGSFDFDSLPGSYKLKILKNGYLTYSNHITVPNEFTYTIPTVKLLRYNLEASEFDSHAFPTVLESGDSLTIIFSLVDSGSVNLVVYDSYGRKIKTVIDNQNYNSGLHRVIWDGRNEIGKIMERGVYFYILKFNKNKIINKIIIK